MNAKGSAELAREYDESGKALGLVIVGCSLSIFWFVVGWFFGAWLW